MSDPGATLLTREALLHHRREVLGIPPRRLAGLGAVSLVGLAGTWWLRGRVAALESVPQVMLTAGAILVAVPVATLALGFVAVSHTRRDAMRCPHCAKNLLFDVTLATQRCGWCGERIVQDELPSDGTSRKPTTLPTRPELAQAPNRGWAEANRFGLVLIVVLFAGILGFMPVADWMDQHVEPAWAHLTLGVLGLTFFGLLASAAAWQLRSAARRLGLHCPACQSSLLLQRRGNLAIATGRCPCCGAAVATEACPLTCRPATPDQVSFAPRKCSLA